MAEVWSFPDFNKAAESVCWLASSARKETDEKTECISSAEEMSIRDWSREPPLIRNKSERGPHRLGDVSGEERLGEVLACSTGCHQHSNNFAELVLWWNFVPTRMCWWLLLQHPISASGVMKEEQEKANKSTHVQSWYLWGIFWYVCFVIIFLKTLEIFFLC